MVDTFHLPVFFGIPLLFRYSVILSVPNPERYKTKISLTIFAYSLVLSVYSLILRLVFCLLKLTIQTIFCLALARSFVYIQIPVIGLLYIVKKKSNYPKIVTKIFIVNIANSSDLDRLISVVSYITI